MRMVEMTGKDLIIYILQNDLVDKPVYENGRLLGFMTVEETAVKFEVGVATILTWIQLETLTALRIGEELFIPIDATNPIEGVKNV